MFAFVLLDGMPWAYMCGAAITGLHRLLHASLFEGKYIALPRHTPTSSPERKSGDDHNSPPLSKRRIFLTSILALLVVGLIGNLPGFLTSLAPHKPPQPQNVHVVMLTVPRLRDLTSDVLIDSIQSYTTPWRASSNFSSSLTVFAHVGSDGNHAAFDRANAYFHTSADVNTRALPVTFHIEPPPAHEEPVMNHHAHLADAVKYARKSGEEWTMFVEDDFVLCGEWGWESLMRIMERLSEVDGDRKRLNGGFIGTGGRYVLLRLVRY
ncbi:hypothetical protein BDY19DRAFT_140628 [Irpex rosettiformis]|uniref:Uncharacterized protein n=1 Tax=Irpex rosettiformis TaxID=378272 RepID=A0ACB8U5X9_9APHY|nr:hypothetical protein BDY19DRAFT_140628 [Irpex rosettiformis]